MLLSFHSLLCFLLHLCGKPKNVTFSFLLLISTFFSSKFFPSKYNFHLFFPSSFISLLYISLLLSSINFFLFFVPKIISYLSLYLFSMLLSFSCPLCFLLHFCEKNKLLSSIFLFLLIFTLFSPNIIFTSSSLLLFILQIISSTFFLLIFFHLSVLFSSLYFSSDFFSFLLSSSLFKSS